MIDAQWDGGDIIGEIENPFAQPEPFTLPDSVRNSTYYDDIKLLQNKDTFVRFQAVGKIVESDPEVVKYLVDSIVDSVHRPFNRDVMECIHYFFYEDRLTDSAINELFRLLDAKDREVRILIADDFGIWSIGLAGEAETSLYDADLKGPLALVMGSEGEGMRRLTREHCDVLASLPMKGDVESLNVSVATGITLFEAVRQRTNPLAL